MGSILVVDDDRNHLTVMQGLIERSGSTVVTAPDVDAAVSCLERAAPDVVVTDLIMPGRNGMDLLALCRERWPAVPVIMLTGHADVGTAVSAMKLGAHDFITKPVDERELLDAVRKALAESGKNRELVSAYFDHDGSRFPEVVGRAPAVREMLETVGKIASSDSTVLILGETGTGKELIAKSIHQTSIRRDKPFVKVNCAAIPETLAESELFGYEKGAFTGAVTSKPGRFELAHEGTLFLDEVGDMPFPIQARLLGALQDRAIERVGGVRTIKVDVRILAATNRDLQADVSAGRFRADLFFRLNVVPVRVPPLRERKDDILPLLEHFLHRFARRHGKSIGHVSPEVTNAFVRYDWPGNIRELENAVERMVLLSNADAICGNLLPPGLREGAAAGAPSGFKGRIEGVVTATEKQMIIDALNRTGQNRTRAAELLGISRRSLLNKIKDYGL